MTGRLFGNNEVQFHPETFFFSNDWNAKAAGVAELRPEKQALVQLFHDLCNEYENPFVIDVGSHAGTFPLAVASLDSVRGWAFEPHSAVCQLLNHNLVINGLPDRFTVFQKALSNYPGRRILKSPIDNKKSALSCIGQPNFSPYQEQYVDVVTLDDLASAGLESADIINIDTEGSELFVLIGAAETINKHKPDILLTVNWANLNQLDVYINNLTDYLELIGYHGHWVGAENLLFRHPYRKATIKKHYFVKKPDINGLKIAILKQRYDVFGPWRSEKYDHAHPLDVLKKWPSKYNMLETTHLFQADWFVLPFCHDSKLVRQKIDYHQQTFDDNMEFIQWNINDIPLDEYDVVISLDPILRPPRNSSTLYAYFQNEHHHNEYTQSIRTPLPGYDLFLDHMMKASSWVYDLPQPVAFPYPRDPFTARGMCTGQRADDIWFDKRFVMLLTHGRETFHGGGFENTIASLEKRFRSRVTFRNMDFEDMTRWGDPLDYMTEMSNCSYYVNLIACGAGQGLCDAASLGLICFGSAKLPYHKAICHPICLCSDLSELEWKLSMVRSSSDLQQEIRAWQDTALSDLMVTQPLHMLQAAVDMKRRQTSPASADYSKSPVLTELTVDDLPQDIGLINSLKLKQWAQEEYDKGSYKEAVHRYQQAQWFDRSNPELLYLLALASYAAQDHKKALSYVAECLEINSQFRSAITLQSILLREDSGAGADDYTQCRARVLYLVYNRFDGYNKEVDGDKIEVYNAILDELLHDYIQKGDSNNQLLIQHHKLRLNRISAF